jgi:hypothetical protein
MPLSVTLHGIATVAGPNQNGRWATADIVAADGTDNIIYTVPGTVEYLIGAISILNRSDEAAVDVNIAIAKADVPIDSEFIEWKTSMVPRGVLERTQLLMEPGDRIIVRYGTYVAPAGFEDEVSGATVAVTTGNTVTNYSPVSAEFTGAEVVSLTNNAYNFATTQTRTLEGWFWPANTLQQQDLVSLYTDAGEKLTVCWDNTQSNTIRVEWNSGVATENLFGAPFTSVVQDQWNHFAVGFDSSQLTIWVNGVRTLAQWNITPDLSNWSSGNSIYIGGDGTGSSFDGYIDQIRLSDIQRYDPINTSFALPGVAWTVDADTLALFTPY